MDRSTSPWSRKNTTCERNFSNNETVWFHSRKHRFCTNIQCENADICSVWNSKTLARSGVLVIHHVVDTLCLKGHWTVDSHCCNSLIKAKHVSHLKTLQQTQPRLHHEVFEWYQLLPSECRESRRRPEETERLRMYTVASRVPIWITASCTSPGVLHRVYWWDCFQEDRFHCRHIHYCRVIPWGIFNWSKSKFTSGPPEALV